MFCNHCSTLTAEHPWALCFFFPVVYFFCPVSGAKPSSKLHQFKISLKTKIAFLFEKAKGGKDKVAVYPNWQIFVENWKYPSGEAHHRLPAVKLESFRRRPNPPNCPLTKKTKNTKKTNAEKRIFTQPTQLSTHKKDRCREKDFQSQHKAQLLVIFLFLNCPPLLLIVTLHHPCIPPELSSVREEGNLQNTQFPCSGSMFEMCLQ